MTYSKQPHPQTTPPLTDMISLQQAVALGYATRDTTLLSRINRGTLQAYRVGRQWMTTESWLKQAGYSKD